MGKPACKGSCVKIRVLLLDERVLPGRPTQPRPRVVFKGSEAAHDIYQRTRNVAPPKGHRFIVQTANPDERGFRTGFGDLTARAKALRTL